MAKPKIVFVQLRLEPEMAEQLREAGEAEGRKLPAEIVRRLQQSLSGGEPALDQALYGPGEEATRRNRAIAQATGILAARFGKFTGASGDASQDQATTLAMLKVAAPVFFDRLGADDDALTPDHHAVAKAFAQNLTNDLQSAQDHGAAARALFPEQEALARIADGLRVGKARSTTKRLRSKSGR